MQIINKIEEIHRINRLGIYEIQEATNIKDLESLRIKYLGRNGLLTNILRCLGKLNHDERKSIGKEANIVKQSLKNVLNQSLLQIKTISRYNNDNHEIDVTMPGRRSPLGRVHPITKINRDVCNIFLNLGFTIVGGPDIELDYYNFKALNMPIGHPARNVQDTFYFNDNVLLRTHTSPVQIRTMEKQKPPIRIIAPGRVYRRDLDSTHTPMFHQVEGLFVDRNVTFSELKGLLTYFIYEMFGTNIELRFRNSYFPFTEPSLEIDIRCIICNGNNCRVCKTTGWLEILGAGMVHPSIFENVNYDPEEFTGFAFGLGIERIAMLKYKIDDIRLFFENDIRFLKQF